MGYLVIGLVFFCGFIRYGSAILCYECNSAINSLCADPIPSGSLTRNCSELDRGVTHTMCRKIIQHVDHAINGKNPESRIVRTCGWDDSKFQGICYHRAGYGGRQEVCSCNSDYCNSGIMITSTLTTLGMTLLMAAMTTAAL